MYSRNFIILVITSFIWQDETETVCILCTHVIHLCTFKIGEKSYAYLKSETEKNYTRLIEVLSIHDIVTLRQDYPMRKFIFEITLVFLLYIILNLKLWFTKISRTHFYQNKSWNTLNYFLFTPSIYISFNFLSIWILHHLAIRNISELPAYN